MPVSASFRRVSKACCVLAVGIFALLMGAAAGAAPAGPGADGGDGTRLLVLLFGAQTVLMSGAIGWLLLRHGRARRSDAQTIEGQAHRWHTLLASIGDGVLATDTGGLVTQLNPAAAAMIGWPIEEALGRPIDTVMSFVDPATWAPLDNPVYAVLCRAAPIEAPSAGMLLARDGAQHAIECSANPIRDARGALRGCVIVFRDVGERHRAEAEREESERRFRALVGATASIVWNTDASGNFVVPQSSWAEYTGQSWAQMRAEGWLDAVHPDDRERVRGAWARARTAAGLAPGDAAYRIECRLWQADGGAWRRFEVHALALFDARGAISEWIGMCVDVEERHRLAGERAQHVSLVENSADFIGLAGLDLRTTWLNQAAMKAIGIGDVHAVQRLELLELFAPEDRDRIGNDFLPSVLAQGQGEIEVRLRQAGDGGDIWVLWRMTLLRGADGAPTAIALLGRDITQRQQIEDYLRQLAEDLSAADRRKDEFIAMLAHELRNPLAPIRNALRMIDLQGAADPAIAAPVAMIGRQVDQLVHLVDDLLDVGRINQGRIALRRERVELAQIVEAAVDAARPACDERTQVLLVELPDAPVVLDADRVRLAQAIGNLLDNACKHSGPKASIAVAVRVRDDDRVELRVRDDGAGIAAEHLASVFDMFMQGDTSLGRPSGGLGLGLTLVKTIVEMHGGTVHASSAGVGKGSEFVLTLPLADAGAGAGAAPAAALPAAAFPQRPASAATTPAGHDAAPGDTPRAVADAPQSPAVSAPESPASDDAPGGAPPGTPLPGGARRILVVDDNHDAAASLAMLLDLSGDHARTAHDGLQALDVAAEFRPQVVLLDIGLPGIDGYEVARRIRREPWGRQLVLIAITGWGKDEDRRRSREAGFDAHLVKPVAHLALLDLLKLLGTPVAQAARRA
ncbi:MAG: PAS domain S-box protein [Lautropia sp.]